MFVRCTAEKDDVISGVQELGDEKRAVIVRVMLKMIACKLIRRVNAVTVCLAQLKHLRFLGYTDSARLVLAVPFVSKEVGKGTIVSDDFMKV